MKIVAKTTELIEAVNIVQKAVGSKSTLPILDGILIETYGDNIKLTGNNLEIGIEFTLNGVVTAQGSIVANSKIFGDVVRKLPDAEVFMEVKGERLIIDCLKSHFEISALSPEGYPKLPSIESEKYHVVGEGTLKNMIRKTFFAVGTDESKKNLTGSLFEWTSECLTIVSIDGFRMALAKTQKAMETQEFSIIVPGHALNEIVKIIGNENEGVKLCVNRSLISFEFGQTKVVSRLIEAEYINYKNVIPNYHETSLKINTRDFLSSLERAYLISMEDKKYPVKFTVTEDKFIISSTATMGSVREEVNAQITGSSMEVGFNPKYFIDALRAIDDEEVNLFLTSNIGPATIRPIEGDDYVYMILPVMISSQNSNGSEE